MRIIPFVKGIRSCDADANSRSTSDEPLPRQWMLLLLLQFSPQLNTYIVAVVAGEVISFSKERRERERRVEKTFCPAERNKGIDREPSAVPHFKPAGSSVVVVYYLGIPYRLVQESASLSSPLFLRSRRPIKKVKENAAQRCGIHSHTSPAACSHHQSRHTSSTWPSFPRKMPTISSCQLDGHKLP